MSENNTESSPPVASPPEAIPVETNKLTIQNPDTIGYINPDFNEPVPAINRFESIIENQLKVEIYNRARMVKIISIIDMFFIILQLAISIALNNMNWIVFLFFPMCYAGYYGSKNYNHSSIIGYCCYLFIMSIIYLTMVFAYANFFYLIIFFLETYILIFTMRLSKILTLVDQNIIESLQNGWSPDQGLVVLYYY